MFWNVNTIAHTKKISSFLFLCRYVNSQLNSQVLLSECIIYLVILYSVKLQEIKNGRESLLSKTSNISDQVDTTRNASEIEYKLPNYSVFLVSKY